ncbi:MAG: ABC transporter permease [Rhodospirillaceae bacterium]
MNSDLFSLARVKAVLAKEFVQMRRDRLTFAMMVGIPIMQLLLFGYAINTDPRHLPTLVEMGDSGPASRAVVQAMENSLYFDVQGTVTRGQAEDALKNGDAIFVLTIPPGFERAFARGDRAQLLLDADASDPVAAGAGVGAIQQIVEQALEPFTSPHTPAVETIVHRRYNAASRTAVNIVPGLLGVILTMTMVMMTAIAITRETERGTLETLLATPARPLEVMVGKITPYIFVGFIQVSVMLVGAHFLFDVPFAGNPLAFVTAVLLFILVNLSIGFFFSTIARSQMQAMQMTFFMFLPSILLSGFMFPFYAMPGWAQAIGQILPNTHFLRAIRGVMLKGGGFTDIWMNLLPLAITLAVVAALAVKRYRRTLD